MKANWLLGILVLSLGMSLAACGRSALVPVDAPASAAEAEVDCTQAETNPIAQSIADKFNVPYEQVVKWACSGESLDDILLALQTSKIANRTVEELLALKKEGGWDKVWETVGLVMEQAQQGQATPTP